MAIDPMALRAFEIRDMPFSYRDRETMLYALSVGMGRDPLDADELAFCYEGAGLKAVPTQAVVIASTGIVGKLGLDYTRILHAEQRLVLHRPLPAAGDILADSRVTAAIDKGEGKGAILCLETSARSAEDGAALFTFTATVLARGDGGFGEGWGEAPAPHAVPARAPDASVSLATRPDAALLYRLNADRNPLHADPSAARRVGFERPILHGLATYGIACRAVLAAMAGYDAAAIRSFDARFSAPVLPGDEIVTDLWRDGEAIAFRCRVPARDATVLDHGRCTLGAPA